MNIFRFERKDIVRLRNRKHYEVNRLDDGKYSLFTIETIESDGAELQNVVGKIPFSDLEPVSISEKDAKYIYFSYSVAASMVGSDEQIPIHTIDKSYFLDAFKKTYTEDQTLYYDVVKHAKMEYVHEVQHWLRNNNLNDELRISDSELLNLYIRSIEQKVKKDKYYYMRLSIEEMRKSIQEPREDKKVSPSVGAVLLKPNGQVVTAHRGELREGDHAEFTLLERKCLSEDLKGSIVFSTLEPCFERHMPKVACSQRLVDARIAKVYIGIEDPDPSVSGKGMALLHKNGVEYEMYPPELQAEIEECNKEFIKGAYKRRKESEQIEDYLSPIEKAVEVGDIQMIYTEKFIQFLKNIELNPSLDDIITQTAMRQLGIFDVSNNHLKPTGFGLLLFGKQPQYTYPNAVIKATYIQNGKEQSVATIEGPIIEQSIKLYEWYKDFVPHHLDRNEPTRKIIYDYPLDVISEVIKNAIVHRDYSIKGAPIYFEISEDKIVIKSPGDPISPINIGQLKSFNAPSRSRNPLIMYVFDKLELAEQRGFGFKTIKELPYKGFSLPEVEYDSANIIITLPLKKGLLSQKTEKLTDRQRKVYEYIQLHPLTSRKEIEQSFFIETKTAEREIKVLLDSFLISKIGDGPSVKYSIV